jgi:hypothetical protein
MDLLNKLVAIPFRPTAYKTLTIMSAVSSVILGAQSLRDLKETDKKWWYIGLGAAAIGGAILLYGYKPEKKGAK